MIEYLFYLLALISLPGSIELLMLTLGAFLPFQFPKNSTKATLNQLYFLIPAHNEELHIEKTLKSVLAKQSSEFVLVVADHCTDNTVEMARKLGVEVLENGSTRGKGEALYIGINKIMESFNGYIAVIDADCEIAPNFSEVALDLLGNQVQALQVSCHFTDAWRDIKTRLMKIALFAFKDLRPLGRERLGFSAGLSGTGFILSTEILKNVPYKDNSIVEDLSYHLKLVEAGYKAWFTEKTHVLTSMPVSKKGLEEQRTRWEGGRLNLMIQEAPKLLLKIVKGQYRLIEPLLDLALLPLAFHIVLLFIIAIELPLFAFVSLLIVSFHVLAAMVIGKASWEDWKALFYAPFYILWKVTLLSKIWGSAKKGADWVRTDRN